MGVGRYTEKAVIAHGALWKIWKKGDGERGTFECGYMRGNYKSLEHLAMVARLHGFDVVDHEESPHYAAMSWPHRFALRGDEREDIVPPCSKTAQP